MKLFVLCLTMLISGQNVLANGRGIGAGVAFGDPTAITAKYWVDSESAYDAGLAFLTDRYMLVYGDYHYHLNDLFKRGPAQELSPYIGVGAIVAISTGSRSSKRKFLGESNGDLGIAARIPVGIEWLPKRVPIGVFGELVPAISVIPETVGFFQGSVGARYYF